jgi:ankyrin repeat protein
MQVADIITIGDLFTKESLENNTEFTDKLKLYIAPSTTRISDAIKDIIDNERLEFGELLKLLWDRKYGVSALYSPFEYALDRNKYSIAEKMLESGFDINSLGLSSYQPPNSSWCKVSAVIFAMSRIQMLEFVLKKDPDLNVRYGSNQETPIMKALRFFNISSARLLLNAGADITLKTVDGKDAIDYCDHPSLKDFKNEILLKYKVETLSDLIFRESRRGDKDIISELNNLGLAESASLSQIVNKCIQMKNLKIIKLIVTDFNTISKWNSHKLSALHMCITEENVEILDYFLKCGADINCLDYCNWSLLMETASRGKLKIIKFLLDKKANVNLLSKIGNNALMLALLYGQFQAAEMLLDTEINIWTKSRCSNARHALEICEQHMSINKTPEQQKVFDMIKQKMEIKTLGDLIARETAWRNDKNVIELNSLNLDNSVSLQKFIEKCVEMDKIDLIKLVVTDFNAIFKSNMEKMHILKSCSVRKQSFDILVFFLKCGADIDMVDNTGWTLLMIATWEDNLDFVKCLLDNNANINVVSKESTALIIAIRNAHFKIADLLLDHNADSSIVPVNGRSALCICKDDIFALSRFEPQKKLLARLEALSTSEVAKNDEPTMIVCTDGIKKISIPEDPLIKLFYDDNLKLDSSMKSLSGKFKEQPNSED